MTTRDLTIGTVDADLPVDLLLDYTLPASPFTVDLAVQAAGIVPEPYVVVAGRPIRDTGYGASINTTSGAKVSQAAASPTVASAMVTSDFRWLPKSDRFTESGARWIPLQSDKSATSLYSPTVAPHHDPAVDYAYDYESIRGTRRQGAVTYNGQGYSIFTPPGGPKRASATIGLVAVLNASNLPYYGIFEANQQATAARGEPLAIRYTQGRLDIFQNDRRVHTYQMRSAVNEASVILLSMDADSDTGRLVVRDSNRYSRAFNVAGLDFISFYGVIGALGQGTTASPYRYRANMDVLEFDFWGRALSDDDMSAQADLLALAYGVGT